MLPGAGGREDRPIKHIKTSNSLAGAANLGANVTVFRPAFTTYSDHIDYWLKFSDYALIGDGQYRRNQLEFRFTDDSVDNPQPGPMDVYSMRVYFRMDAWQNALTGAARIFAFLNGDGNDNVANYRWSYTLREYGFYILPGTETGHMPQLKSGRDTIFAIRYDPGTGIPTEYGPGPSLGQLNNYRCVIGQTYRAEVQVDNTRPGNKVFVRIYRQDETTMRWRLSLRGSPAGGASVAADRIYFGDDTIEFDAGLQQVTFIGGIEIHNDFNLGGQFTAFPPGTSDAAMVPNTDAVNGTPYLRKSYEWFEWDGADLVPVDDLGEFDGVSAVVDTGDVDELRFRDTVPPPYVNLGWFIEEGGDETNNNTQFYVGAGETLDYEGNPAFPFGLFYPSGTPPEGGWPLWTWAHSGFFVTGTYRQMPRPTIHTLLSMGYAVATIGYRRGAIWFANSGPYPSYPDIGSYPQFIWNYKNAVNYIRSKGHLDHGGNGDWPINGDRIIMSGYSAGGYIALASAVSRDLASDGLLPTPNDLRGSAEDPGRLATPGWADPPCLGVVVWGAPINMQWAADNDDTHPDFGVPTSPVIIPPDLPSIQASETGLVVAAGKAIMRKHMGEPMPNIDHVGIPNLIARNTLAKLPPHIHYVRGTSDYLIKEQHVGFLEDALIAKGYTGEFSVDYEAGVIHDRLMDMVSWEHIRRWLATVPGAVY